MPAEYNPPPAWANIHPVERAAHLYQCYETWRASEICAEEGITEEDRDAGAHLAEERRHQRNIEHAVSGNPMYGGGSW